MKPDYSAWLTSTRLVVEERLWVDPKHATWQQFVAHIVQLSTGVQPIGSIIEFGCGIGLVAPNIPLKVRYIGIDANYHCIARARTRNPERRLCFFQEDVRKVSALVVGADFDLSCAFSFMKHFAEEEWAAVLHKVLAFGKRGLFSMRVGETNTDDGTDFPHFQATPEFISAAVVAAGHSVINVTPLPWGEVMVATCLI